ATIKVAEPGPLTAASIEGGPELEIVDSTVNLATLSEEGAVDAELIIRRGRGFVPADEQERRDLGVGFIFLDAAFSPVRKANFRIEPARVGQATDYEKLVLEVWTNGAILPSVAVAEAARLLADHLPIFVNLEGAPPVVPAPAHDSVLDRPIEGLEVGVRILNMLRSANIASVRDLVAFTDDELQKLPGLGKKAVAEIRDRLEMVGLGLGMRFDLPQS
ncbi:MAG: DNA-directed RNA polymerase subunit alpha, partial [Thermoanaerobaculaceae bacterium]|nr:DNA-directed RNA polymerase subunit alpha [Thermoanaerobaculaceae bacterium]